MRSAIDHYGTALLHLDGSTGGKRHLLLLCPLEQSQVALEVLQNLSFKGRVTLAVLPELHSTLVLALVAELEPSVVLALDAAKPLSSGDALILAPLRAISSTGLEYVHGGEFAAWRSGLLQAAHGASLLATVAASVHRAVLACAPADMPELLKGL